jgi:beta-barrel assembly-enhancing protease
LKVRLLASIDEPKHDYSIYVIRNRTVNAFALPGGNIVLHSGLLRYAESPEEVAAVLAHEIGHSEEGHIMQKLIKEVGFSVLFSAITGGDIGVFSDIGRRFVTTRFDREYELEADNFALGLMEDAGVNPRYLAVFFHRLSEEDGNIMDRIDFLSTHPSHDARRQNALAYETGVGFEERPIEGVRWELVQGLAGR